MYRFETPARHLRCRSSQAVSGVSAGGADRQPFLFTAKASQLKPLRRRSFGGVLGAQCLLLAQSGHFASEFRCPHLYMLERLLLLDSIPGDVNLKL